MEEQLKQIIDKKVTQKEATLILTFALLEVMKQLDALNTTSKTQQDTMRDFPLIKKLVFGAVGVILLAVMGALIALVVAHR